MVPPSMTLPCGDDEVGNWMPVIGPVLYLSRTGSGVVNLASHALLSAVFPTAKFPNFHILFSERFRVSSKANLSLRDTCEGHDLDRNLCREPNSPMNQPLWRRSTPALPASDTMAAKSEADGHNDQLIISDKHDHPANLIPSLCAKFWTLGWVTGTGGGCSIREE